MSKTMDNDEFESSTAMGSLYQKYEDDIKQLGSERSALKNLYDETVEEYERCMALQRHTIDGWIEEIQTLKKERSRLKEERDDLRARVEELGLTLLNESGFKDKYWERIQKLEAVNKHLGSSAMRAIEEREELRTRLASYEKAQPKQPTIVDSYYYHSRKFNIYSDGTIKCELENV